MSEIDDIFAGKAKGKASVPTGKVDIPSLSSSSTKDKKKKSKKKKSAPDAVPTDPPVDASAVASSSKKRPAPETIVDTSYDLAGPSKRHKGEQASEEPKASRSRSKKAVEPDAAFKDSRGTSDRRKTEEGWSVYKEDELGIGDEGGDTPLCPFDCDCCF